MTTGPGTSGRDGGLNLQTAITSLLPPESARDWKSSASNLIGTNARPLNEIIASLVSGDLIDWQKYEPAIRHWEAVTGRPAPWPAALGPRSGIKPAPQFVEWMMAVFDGRVSGTTELTINQMLKLLGNGVVPAQAEYAIRLLTQGNEEVMTQPQNDTSSFFTSHQSRDVPRDQWGRYELPDPETGEPAKGWTRATTFAATLAESYGLRIWKERQVVWGLSRRPDLITLASTISGPEDKKALGSIVDEAHIAAGTDGKANRGTAIHRACQASERGAHHEVPEELRPHVAGYFTALKDAGLQILPEYVERTVVLKRYHVAGTFDNILRCPDGKLRIGDKKTGNLDYADIEFAVQLAVYAHADAIFNYDTGRYEPMPEIETDYAIIAHIDPVSGKTELQRVNIEWGWVWARTCAEVMDIRKTKHVITPYVDPFLDKYNEHTPEWGSKPKPITDTPSNAVISGPPTAHVLPPNMTRFAQNSTPIEVPPPGVSVVVPSHWTSELVHSFERSVREKYGDTAQVTWTRRHDGEMTATVDKSSVIPHLNGTVPGGYVDSTSSVPDEFQAFWSDDRHDDDPPWETGIPFTEHINGVPLEQYGQSAKHPCASGQSCEPTGTDGLHEDGTVCLYGNARPGPITPVSVLAVGATALGSIPDTTHVDLTAAAVEAQQPDATPQSVMAAASAPAQGNADPDELMHRILGIKGGKASVQKIARELMTLLGIKESDPNSIKLSQYQHKIASAIITLAHSRSVSIPGVDKDGKAFGQPAGPGPDPDVWKNGTAGGADASAQKASGAGGTEVNEFEGIIRAAVTSIRGAVSLNALQLLHAHFAEKTRVGWTPEMQDAARTRALELEDAAGETPLTPMQMIEGATSKETLQKAWTKATDGGKNRDGWTAELDAAAKAKVGQLNQSAPVATTGNQ